MGWGGGGCGGTPLPDKIRSVVFEWFPYHLKKITFQRVFACGPVGLSEHWLPGDLPLIMRMMIEDEDDLLRVNPRALMIFTCRHDDFGYALLPQKTLRKIQA